MLPESKTCSVCHTPKPLSEFHVIHKKGQNPYTQGHCKLCEKARRRAYDAKNYEKNREKRRAYDSERAKCPEYKKRQVEYKRKHKKTLTDGIVAYQVSKKLEIPIPEVYKIEGLIEAERSRLLLSRQIKKIETADPNFRVCFKCDEKKILEEFRLRTEYRKGKEPYTYRSGQCKKCESIIKKSYAKNRTPARD